MTDGANIPFLLPGRPRHNLPGLGEVGLHKSLLPPVVNPCTEDFHLGSSLIAIYNQGTQVESLDDNRKKMLSMLSSTFILHLQAAGSILQVLSTSQSYKIFIQD